MPTLQETVDVVLDENADLVAAAQDGDDTALNRLTARVMDAHGIAPDAAATAVDRALDGGEFTTGVDAEGFTDYMEQLAERGDRSEWTTEAYASSISKFTDWYEAHRNPDVPPTAADVNDWLDHLALEEDLKGSTIQRHFHGLQAYFKWEGRAGELAGINVADEYPDRSGGTPEYLDWAEVEALRAATVDDDPDVVCWNTDCDREPWAPAKDWQDYDAPPRCPACDTTNTDWSRDAYDFVIVQLLTGLGIRVGEFVRLDIDDVDLEARTLDVERQKRTSTWIDPMHLLDTDVRAIRAYLDQRDEAHYPEGAVASDALFVTDRRGDLGWRAHPDFVRGRLNRVAIDAGVKTYDEDGTVKTDVHPHLLRHTVSHRLWEAGYSDYQVGSYLGHSKDTSTSRYGGLSPETFREMREVVDGRREGPTG